VNALIRWGKFNAVGAMGMAVQLAALAAFNRLAPGHYLLTSAAALEVTLVHNFIWHLRYTWRDRQENSSRLTKLLRFHLSNGMVSLVGNLVLMRILVGESCLPVLAANAIAILLCSLVNYGLGDRWVFAEKGRAGLCES
jgi:putative flippase GtrA